MKKTIAYQGVPASYSYAAAQAIFGRDNTFTGCARFAEIFKTVGDGVADCGIIPIENSLASSIFDNYDLLYQEDVYVVGEYYLPIQHFLLAKQIDGVSSEERLGQIKKVFSHTQALEQCSQFFDEHPELEEIVYSDTAGAARHVAENPGTDIAAIASRGAGELYRLEVIAENIQNQQNNITRFVVIAKAPVKDTEVDKGSIILELAHNKPGALLEILSIFADQNINLSKLQSRPIGGSSFEYMFYIDFEFDGNIEKIESVLDEVKKHTAYLKKLGYYKSGDIPHK